MTTNPAAGCENIYTWMQISKTDELACIDIGIFANDGKLVGKSYLNVTEGVFN